MTVNALPAMAPAPAHLPQPAAPFCDKKFKVLRLVVDGVVHLCRALFYKIISLCSFNAATSHKYNRLSHLEVLKTRNLSSFLKFGNEVIDFSYNSFPHVKETLPADRTELDALKMLYGADKVDRVCQHYVGDTAKNTLTRFEIGDGCYLGMSIDFISSYLRQKELGEPALEAIKSLAPHFANGPTEDAQLCQIMEMCGREAIRQEREEDLPLQLLLPMPLRRNPEQLDEGMRNRFMQEAIERRNRNHHWRVQNAPLVGYENIVRFAKLITNRWDVTNRVNAEFAAFVQQLPVGAYEINLSKYNTRDEHQGNGHSIAFIKTAEGMDFIFDPSIGTLAVEQNKSSLRLWDVAQPYMNEVNYIHLHGFTRYR